MKMLGKHRIDILSYHIVEASFSSEAPDGTNAAAGSPTLKLTQFLGERNVAYWCLF
jgi:hypothetical protein